MLFTAVRHILLTVRKVENSCLVEKNPSAHNRFERMISDYYFENKNRIMYVYFFLSFLQLLKEFKKVGVHIFLAGCSCEYRHLTLNFL